MTRPHKFLMTALAASIAGSVSAGTVTTDGPDIVISTDGNLKAETTDGQSGFKIGGRLQLDANFYEDGFNHADGGDSAENAQIRRARLFAEGFVKKVWKYKLQLDFEDDNQEVDVEDAYIQYGGFPNLNITAGNFKEGFGLEELTSSKWISTIERSSPNDFFAPSRALGLAVDGRFVDKVGIQAGIFRGDRESEDDGGDSRDFALRGVFAPFSEEGRAAHVGIGYSDREFTDDEFSFNNELRFGDDLDFDLGVDTGIEQQTVNFEAAGVLGPVSIQGEYFIGDLETDDPTAFSGEDEFDAEGYYALASFFVTGESRNYSFKKLSFDKIKPKNAYGAVELVARWSHIEIDESALDAEADFLTLGVNWYLNKNVRMSANYLHTEYDGDNLPASAQTEDDGDAFAVRFQYVF